MSVTVRVLFFGATADVVGRREVDLSVEVGSTAGVVFERVVEEHPYLKRHKLLLSLNQVYARGDERVNDGDEVAVFTAVSGG
jgi:molybdopterin converting factor small subunit